MAIARALANRPRIILADEPTAPLNSERARIVMDLLRRIAVDQSAAIIVVTHDEMILDRFDHIFRLRDGRLENGARVGVKPEFAPSVSAIRLAVVGQSEPRVTIRMCWYTLVVFWNVFIVVIGAR